MDEQEENDRLDYLFNLLLEMGAVEIYGISAETGETIYRVTDACEELFPELWKMQIEHIGETAYKLWQKGLIELNITATGETVYFREHNYLKYLDIVDTLDEEEKRFIAVFIEDL